MQKLATAFLLSAATSLCSAQSLTPGERITTELVAASVPAQPGWQISNKAPARIAIARAGTAPDETFAAFAIVFRIENPRDREHFLDLIRAGVAADTPPVRFREVKADFRHDDSRVSPCVRYSAIHEDTQAKLRTGGTGTLTFQSLTLYCLHPKEQGVAFAFGYSHRGRQLQASFDEDGAQFIASGDIRGQ